MSKSLYLRIGALLHLSALGALLAVHGVQAEPYNWKPVQIHGGGFVSGILFHPDEPGLMYCRTDIGGSYRWNPTNDTWIPLLDFIGYPNDEWSLVGTESIGLDAQDPDRLYLSCGWLGNPSELMISTDRGASFTRINSPFVIRANNDGRGTGERFGVDPNLGSAIFYGTRENGLWKSGNYAANWAKVNSFPVNTTPDGVGISFVEFIQSSGTPGSATPVIWVGVSQTGTNLFRSTDAGLTWTGVATTGVPTNCLPLRAAQDGLGNMYVTFCDAAGPGGVSTGVVRKFNLTTLDSTDVTPPTGQGGYGGVSVDRQNPNRIVVTTANRWWPTSDIYRSTDGGTNWTAVYNGTVDTSSAPWMGEGGNVVQGWMFDVKIDPYNSDRVYYVTGGGVFSSYDFTTATPAWQFRSTGIEETAFTSIGANLASPPSGPQVWSVLGDMGGFSHYDLDASPALTNYYNPHRANNYGIDFAEQSPQVVVRTYSDFSGDRGGYISTDYGDTWSEFPATPPPAQTDSGPGSVAISADGTRLVWTIAGSAPYYSTDGGATWTPCAGSNLTPTVSWIEPFCFSDRVNPDTFYLYYRNTGGVFVSTDGGASFNLASTITAWGDSMRPAYGQEGSLWVAVYDGLWRTTNSGASFSKVPGVQAARTVGFGRTATGTGHPVVYVHGQIGGVWGVYRSEDQGTNWTRINDDQHQFGNIQQVVGDPKIYGRCYIAAGGRGILYGDIPNQPPLTPTGVIATASNEAVQLSWYNAARADSYIVKRSTTSGSGYTNIATGVTATSFTDTGLVNGTTYYYVVAATNAYGTSPDSAEASATPQQITTLFQINSGGAAAGDYAADAYFTGGSTYATGNAIDTSGVVDPAPMAVYQSERWGNMSYTFMGLTPGSDYTVRLHFAEILHTSTGNRVFDVSINGALKLDNFDVFSAAGGKDKAVVREFTITANGSGEIIVQYTGVTDNAKSSGIEVLAVATPPPATPTGLAAVAGDAQVELSWNAASGATDYKIKRSTTSGGGYTPIATNASPAFADTGLANGTLYYYVVRAMNDGGESGDSTEVSARPTSSAPVSLNMAMTNNQLQLNWPVDHTGWNLEYKTNLLDTNGWTFVPDSDATNMLNWGTITNGSVFYRLVYP